MHHPVQAPITKCETEDQSPGSIHDRQLVQRWKRKAGLGGGGFWRKHSLKSKWDIWMVLKNFQFFQLTTAMQWTNSHSYTTPQKKYLVAGLIQTTSISCFLLIEGGAEQPGLLTKSEQKIKKKKKRYRKSQASDFFNWYFLFVNSYQYI